MERLNRMANTELTSNHAVAELINLADRAEAQGDLAERRAFVERATELLVQSGDVQAAIDLAAAKNEAELGAEIAERAGDERRAAQLYAETGNNVRAARARERNGEPALAAELWERAGRFARAASIHETLGDFVRASKLYDKSGEKKRAADLLVRALSGDGTRRLLGPAANEACREAGKLYADDGHLDLAVRVLKWGREMVLASQLLLREGRHDDAVDLLVEAGHLLDAAEAARQAGDEKRAHRLLAKRAEEDGRLKEAAEHLEEAEDFERAGGLYELAEALDRAAAAFERAGRFETAAQHYQRIGRPNEAARCLRAAGRTSDAMDVETQGGSDDSLERLVARGAYLDAAKAALALARAGESERYVDAVQYLERVPHEHADGLAARTLLAEVLAESGEPKRALMVLQRMFVGLRPTAAHVPAMYQYGRLLEREGYLAGARNAYRTAASFGAPHRDLEERLARLANEQAETPKPEHVVASMRPVPTAPMVVGGPRVPRAVSSVAHLMPPIAAETSSASDTMSLIDRELRSLTGNFRIDAPDDARPGMRSSGSSPEVEAEEEPDVLPAEDVVEVLEEQSSETARPDALMGRVLRGRFRIEKKLGRGAQALVYLARDQVLDRAVAIKVLNESVAADETALDRFLREARMAARVHHVGCLAIYDFGQESGLTFMAMEYFKGRTVRDLVKRGPMDVYLVLRIAGDVASALGAVHEAGIIHRDVKPTNVMVDRNGNVRLTDFGVARSQGDESSSGMMVGTMKYMAPEQARGKEADQRADIFSLGVMMFEMLVGKPPFGGSLDALIARVTKPPPPLPEELDIPEDVTKIVMKCMQRKPTQRYRNVSQLVDAMAAARTRIKAERVTSADLRSDDIEVADDDSEDPTQDGYPGLEE
ncbi:MAG: protein kinase [Deltaproteobacteria bacterium]